MRRMTASQKIAHLERRIAKLEREASWTEDVMGMIKNTLNIPKNLIMNLFNSFTEIFRVIYADISKKKEVIYNQLGVVLTIRIARSFTGMTTTKLELPKLVKFDSENPLNSIYTSGIAGKRKVKLSVLANMYDGEQQRRIKSAYLSWYKDYKHIFNPKMSKRKLKDKALTALKKYSKVLYRFFTAVLTIASSVEIATTGILFDLLATIGGFFVVSEAAAAGRVDEFSRANKRIQVNYQKVVNEPELDLKNLDVRQDADFSTSERIDKMLNQNLPPSLDNQSGGSSGGSEALDQAGRGTVEKPVFTEDATKTAPVEEIVEKRNLYGWEAVKKLNMSLIALILAATEKIMYRWVVRTDEFDELARGKKASRYPTISYLTHRLETSMVH